jgi:hypothetical protein
MYDYTGSMPAPLMTSRNRDGKAMFGDSDDSNTTATTATAAGVSGSASSQKAPQQMNVPASKVCCTG